MIGTENGGRSLPTYGQRRVAHRINVKYQDMQISLEDQVAVITGGSRGIGKVVVPVRFGCPAEIACLRLRRAAYCGLSSPGSPPPATK